MRRRLLSSIGKLYIDSFKVDDIPASGGTISSAKALTYHIGKRTTGATVVYSSPITVPSLGTTAKERTKVGQLTVTVTLAGRQATETLDIYLQANVLSPSGIELFNDFNGLPLDKWSKEPLNVSASGDLTTVGGLNLTTGTAMILHYSYTSGANSTSIITDTKDPAIQFTASVNWITLSSPNLIGDYKVENRGTTEGVARSGVVYCTWHGIKSNELVVNLSANSATTKGILLKWMNKLVWSTEDLPSLPASGSPLISTRLEENLSYTSGAIYNKAWDTTALTSDMKFLTDSPDWIIINNTLGLTYGDFTIASRGTTEGAERTGNIWIEWKGFTSNKIKVTLVANAIIAATYKNASITLEASPSTIPATGGNITINAKGNRTRTDTYTSEDTKDTAELVDASLSLSNSNGFTLNGNTVVVTANTGSSRTATITASAYGLTKLLTLTLLEGVETYGDVVIDSFNVNDIPASGGTISSGSGTWHLTWGYNGNTTDGGTINGTFNGTSTSNAASIGYSSAITRGSKGTTLSGRDQAGTLTVTIISVGKSASKEAAVYQSANSVSDWGNSTASCGTVKPSGDIPASGGNATAIIASNASQTIRYSSGATRSANITFSSTTINIGSLGTTVKGRSKVGAATGIFKGENGWSCQANADIYQQANNASYGAWSLTISANPTTISYSGGTSTVTTNATRTVSYTSGASSTLNGTPSLAITANASGNPFSLSGNTVSVGLNNTTDERLCTVTATIN